MSLQGAGWVLETKGRGGSLELGLAGEQAWEGVLGSSMGSSGEPWSSRREEKWGCLAGSRFIS